MIKFKIRIFKLFAKFILKQLSIKQIRHCLPGQNQIWHIFLSKNIKVFQWFSKLKFVSFMTKVNLNNGNETKWDILPWNIFKSDNIFVLSKCIKVFQWLPKSVKPNNGSETKSDIFSWDIFKSDIFKSFFIGHKILKYFNDLYNWHLSILFQKWAQICKRIWN